MFANLAECAFAARRLLILQSAPFGQLRQAHLSPGAVHAGAVELPLQHCKYVLINRRSATSAAAPFRVAEK